jgi:hypothetical protein
LCACDGLVAELEGDGGAAADAGVDAGPTPIVLTGYTPRSDGWPDGGALVGAGLVDGELWAAGPLGLFVLPTGQTAWADGGVALPSGQAPTTLTRFDTTLALTLGGAGGGALFLKAPGEAWSKTTGTPAGAQWQLVKRNGEYLLATSTGLYAAATLRGPWALRSSQPPFTGRVSHLLAATGQQRIFCVDATGALASSDDDGQTWAQGPVGGTVSALAGAGPVVVLQSSPDGAERSSNYGNTFKGMTVGAQASTFAFISQTLFAGTPAGIFVSADLGLTWTPDTASPTLPAGTAVRGLFVAGSQLVLDTSSGPWLSPLP